jgi:hypothetical protein
MRFKVQHYSECGGWMTVAHNIDRHVTAEKIARSVRRASIANCRTRIVPVADRPANLSQDARRREGDARRHETPNSFRRQIAADAAAW